PHDGLSLDLRRAQGRGAQSRRSFDLRVDPDGRRGRRRRRHGDLEARAAETRPAAASLRVPPTLGAGRGAVSDRHVRGHRQVAMEAPRYWFPAKRFGWGWGPPRTWQGWLVLAAFVVLMAVGAVVFLPRHQERAFVAYTAILCGALIAVCYATGEPP